MDSESTKLLRQMLEMDSQDSKIVGEVGVEVEVVSENSKLLLGEIQMEEGNSKLGEVGMEVEVMSENSTLLGEAAEVTNNPVEAELTTNNPVEAAAEVTNNNNPVEVAAEVTNNNNPVEAAAEVTNNNNPVEAAAEVSNNNNAVEAEGVTCNSGVAAEKQTVKVKPRFIENVSEVPAKSELLGDVNSKILEEMEGVTNTDSETLSVVDQGPVSTSMLLQALLGSPSSKCSDIQERKVAQGPESRGSCIKWAAKRECLSPISPASSIGGPEEAPPPAVFRNNCCVNGSMNFIPDTCRLGAGLFTYPRMKPENPTNWQQCQRSFPQIGSTNFTNGMVYPGPGHGQPPPPPNPGNIRHCCCCCCRYVYYVMLKEMMLFNQIRMNSQQYPRPMTSPIPSRPPGFEDPPETEWPVVNVYHIDPSDGTLRYKCRNLNCNGIVEQKSSKQTYNINLSYGRLKHQCEKCNRKYATRRKLKLHQIRHNEKTRICQVCDKRFVTKSELQNHLNTHTREKPYSCPVCCKTFAHSSRYYAHIRLHHKKYDCESCFSKVCKRQ